MTVGQRIKERRKELGISADELGKRIGKNRATIFRYENAEALLTTPRELMGWEDEENTAPDNGSGMSKAKSDLLDLVENCSDEEAARLLQMMELFLGKK